MNSEVIADEDRGARGGSGILGMVPSGRLSIALLMAVVILVAVDFATVRALWKFYPLESAVAIITLPMIKLLILAMPKLRSGHPARPFWVGFQVMGWWMVVVFAACVVTLRDGFFAPLFWIDRISPFPKGGSAESAWSIGWAVVIYTIPQFTGAIGGGWFSSKYRVIIERR